MMSTNVVKCKQCNIIINELLCFVQNKISVMDEESIVRLVVSAFSEEEIDIAKDLVFCTISTTHRQVSRRKNKQQRNVEDIISLFKCTEPDSSPIFVASQLHKLPPVTFDHVDATRVLKDIILLQSELKQIKETYASITWVRSEIENLKHASLVNVDCNVNTRKRGACLFDSGPAGFLNLSTTTDVNDTQTPRHDYGTSVEKSAGFDTRQTACNIPRSHSSPQQSRTIDVSLAPSEKLALSQGGTVRVEATTVVSSDGSGLKPANEAPAPANIVKDGGSDNSNACANNANKITMASIAKQSTEWKVEEPTEKWIEVQRKRYRNRVIEGVRGKAEILPEEKFKAANLKIPLFVSNVHKETSEKDIIDFIFAKTRESIFLQKIKMKNDRPYNAYKMVVTRHKLDMFLNDQLWPDGITCRRFMPYDDLKRGGENVSNSKYV